VLETDAQFGVTRGLVKHFLAHENEPAPAPDINIKETWYSLEHTFVVQPGESWLPTPPISKKTVERAKTAGR
jgi:catechol 1,2-dioxygenase